jgi:hypothetical protein
LKPDKGWQQRFDEPIPLPRGRQLVAFKDAATYITKLPKAEHEAEEWQAAIEALMLVGARRPEDARAHRHHESIEPPRRAGV